MSCPPSTVDSTERSWMPRFSRDRRHARRQAARQADEEVLDRRDAVVLGREDLGVVGFEHHSSLWLCSSPRPKKLWTLIVLCTPLCHLADARQVN